MHPTTLTLLAALVLTIQESFGQSCIASINPSCILFKDDFYDLNNWDGSDDRRLTVRYDPDECPISNEAPCMRLYYSGYGSSDSDFAVTARISITAEEYSIADTNIAEIGVEFDYSFTSGDSLGLDVVYSCDDQNSTTLITKDGSITIVDHYLKLKDSCIGETIDVSFSIKISSTQSDWYRTYLILDSFKLLGDIETTTMKPTTTAPAIMVQTTTAKPVISPTILEEVNSIDAKVVKLETGLIVIGVIMLLVLLVIVTIAIYQYSKAFDRDNKNISANLVELIDNDQQGQTINE